jgi:hypothetical protein
MTREKEISENLGKKSGITGGSCGGGIRGRKCLEGTYMLDLRRKGIL